MIIQVEVPHVGESITEGVLVEWSAENGAYVEQDDPLFVLETDKVTMTINAENAGVLKTLVEPDTTVKIGQVVATIDTEAAKPEGGAPEAGAEQPPRAEPKAEAKAEPAPAAEPEPQAEQEVPQTPGPAMTRPAGMPQAKAKLADMAETGELAPAVRRMVEEFDLDPSQIQGTGRDGRVTKEDVVKYLDRKRPMDAQTKAGDAAPEPPGPPAPPTPPPPQAKAEPAAPKAAKPGPAPEKPAPPAPPAERTEAEIRERQTRVTMTRLRQRIAERLVLAKNEAAILTTFNEADMTHVLAWRERYKETFKKRYGVSLGFMSFFIKAAVDALQAVPEMNAQIQGNEIVQNHYFDIGVAVGTERGLVVPVVRDADRLSFAGIEVAVKDLARKAQDKTLTLGELSGGVFTVSNGGVYGNLLSTPIINPPQSGILGMHAIKKRPVVVDDQIVIRPMMYLAVSYDHRLVDGREAVTFLRRIVDCVENPERMMLEI